MVFPTAVKSGPKLVALKVGHSVDLMAECSVGLMVDCSAVLLESTRVGLKADWRGILMAARKADWKDT